MPIELNPSEVSGLTICYGLNVSPRPPNSYAEILLPNVIILGAEAFWRCLSHRAESS